MPDRVPIARGPEARATRALVYRVAVEEVRGLATCGKARAVDLVWPQVRHILAVQADGPRGEREAPGDQVLERALAGAVGADDRVPLARRHRERDAVDDPRRAEALMDVDELERGAHAAFTSVQRRPMNRAAKRNATKPATSSMDEPTQTADCAASSWRPASLIAVPWVESESR